MKKTLIPSWCSILPVVRRYPAVVTAVLSIVGVAFFVVGTARAGDGNNLEIHGYLAPNFKMIDKGEDTASNLGFGMAFNRFQFKGKVEGGSIVKEIGWKLESDISQTGTHSLQWAFIQPRFEDAFSVRLGHVKEPFSRETLHPTSRLLTVDRHFSGKMSALGYGGYRYGLELHAKHDLVRMQGGAYDGSGNVKKVANQDPSIDLGLRGVLTPGVDGLEIGLGAMLVSLPADSTQAALGNFHGDAGSYTDSENDPLYTNIGFALGLDADYTRTFDDGMSLRVQGEFDTGDNWMARDWSGDNPQDPRPWDEAEFHSFLYATIKTLFMVNKEFGIHLGYSSWDPNTDSEAGKNDGETLLTPGIVYQMADGLRVQAEVQMHTVQMGLIEDLKAPGTRIEADDVDYTHFVLQTVWIW
ncbi:porin [Candidatus Eisenbacteria bacterium]|uniref:Porin n=1 Tax=Eiseniibacteriota bacterium TaxID=2212470 RepID=A0ABV6YI32_UNCEI